MIKQEIYAVWQMLSLLGFFSFALSRLFIEGSKKDPRVSLRCFVHALHRTHATHSPFIYLLCAFATSG